MNNEERLDVLLGENAAEIEKARAGFTREELAACAQKEVERRLRAYPMEVQCARMSYAESEIEKAKMKAIHKLLLVSLSPTIKAQVEMFG